MQSFTIRIKKEFRSKEIKQEIISKLIEAGYSYKDTIGNMILVYHENDILMELSKNFAEKCIIEKEYFFKPL